MLNQKEGDEFIEFEEQVDEESKRAEKPKKHWFWQSWVALALSSATSFSISNMFISRLSSLGIKSVYYFNTGALLLFIGYFTYTREWSKRNEGPRPKMGEEPHRKKVLTRTWETNQIDWLAILLVIVYSAWQTATYVAILFTFKIAEMANLNIGISTSIWSMAPFFMALLEAVFFKVSIKCHQVVGMTLLIICGVLVSISDIVLAEPVQTTPAFLDSGVVGVESKPTEQGTIQIYKAVLFSLVAPCLFTGSGLMTKQVSRRLRLDATDLTIAYWGIIALAFEIVGLFSYSHIDFDFKSWLFGGIGSFVNVMGAIFAINAFSTGAPLGPTSALIGVQKIILMILYALATWTMPSWMQLLGLAFCMVGSLVMTIPTQMKAFILCLLTCKKYQNPSQDDAQEKSKQSQK